VPVFSNLIQHVIFWQAAVGPDNDNITSLTDLLIVSIKGLQARRPTTKCAIFHHYVDYV